MLVLGRESSVHFEYIENFLALQTICGVNALKKKLSSNNNVITIIIIV